MAPRAPWRMSRVGTVAVGLGLVMVLGACQPLEVIIDGTEHSAQHPTGVTITDIEWVFYNDAYRNYGEDFLAGDNSIGLPAGAVAATIRQQTTCPEPEPEEPCSTTFALNKIQTIQNFYLASSDAIQTFLSATENYPDLASEDLDIFWNLAFLIYENDENQILGLEGEGFAWVETLFDNDGEIAAKAYDMRLFYSEDLCGLLIQALGGDRAVNQTDLPPDWQEKIFDAAIDNTTIACSGENSALFPPRNTATRVVEANNCSAEPLAKTGFGPGVLLGGASTAALLVLGGINLAVLRRTTRARTLPSAVTPVPPGPPAR